MSEITPEHIQIEIDTTDQYFEPEIYTGIITSIDRDNKNCSITSSAGLLTLVPFGYHCQYELEIDKQKAYDAGHSAFSVGDEVIITKHTSFPGYIVVGFKSGFKKCVGISYLRFVAWYDGDSHWWVYDINNSEVVLNDVSYAEVLIFEDYRSVDIDSGNLDLSYKPDTPTTIHNLLEPPGSRIDQTNLQVFASYYWYGTNPEMLGQYVKVLDGDIISSNPWPEISTTIGGWTGLHTQSYTESDPGDFQYNVLESSYSSWDWSYIDQSTGDLNGFTNLHLESSADLTRDTRSLNSDPNNTVSSYILMTSVLSRANEIDILGTLESLEAVYIQSGDFAMDRWIGQSPVNFTLQEVEDSGHWPNGLYDVGRIIYCRERTNEYDPSYLSSLTLSGETLLGYPLSVYLDRHIIDGIWNIDIEKLHASGSGWNGYIYDRVSIGLDDPLKDENTGKINNVDSEILKDFINTLPKQIFNVRLKELDIY